MPTSWPLRLLLALAVVGTATGGVLIVRSMSTAPPPADEVAVSETPPTPSESAPPAAPEFAQPKDFRVTVTSSKGEPIDSTNMFGRRQDRRRSVVKNASKFAALTLERYLNEAFVDPRTRFTAAAIKPLLTEQARKALRDADRRALGAEGPEILGGKTVSAKARTVVLYRSSQPYAVTLTYTAKMNIIQVDKAQRMTQTGTMVFKKMGSGGWRADFVDVRLSLPPRPKVPPKPQPSEGATP